MAKFLLSLLLPGITLASSFATENSTFSNNALSSRNSLAPGNSLALINTTTSGVALIEGNTPVAGKIANKANTNSKKSNVKKEEVKGKENVLQLPEVVVKSHRKDVLHILAYIRENSSMSNYGDTVKLFREKWVDFMIPMRDAKRFKGWNIPRLLTSKSYYHFFNYNGLDSVSDEYNQYFSYSDWIEIPNRIEVPKNYDSKTFHIQKAPGKEDVSRLWEKNGDNISVTMNLLTDSLNWNFAPEMKSGFKNIVEFDKFNISFNYNNVDDRSLYATDLNSAVFEIESYGRGYEKYKNSIFQVPSFVTSKIEVFFIEKEFISKKEAWKWLDRSKKLEKLDLAFLFYDVPELDAATQNLVARVNEMNHDKLRTFVKPETRLAGIDLSGNSKKAKKRRLKTIFNSFLNK